MRNLPSGYDHRWGYGTDLEIRLTVLAPRGSDGRSSSGAAGGLAMPYRSKDPSEQEYELATAFVRVGEETKSPVLGQKTTRSAFGTTRSGRSRSPSPMRRLCSPSENTHEYDRLLWRIPDMYARNSNVIPFPHQGYFDQLDRLESMAEGAEDLRHQLIQIPAMSRSDRVAAAGGLWLSMAAIRRGLQAFDTMGIPGKPTPPVWHKKLNTARKRLDWQMSRVACSLEQGRAAEQMSSMLAATLDEIEQLVADQYPMPLGR